MAKKKGQRGKGLERDIDKANEFYRSKGMADIRKVPTPVTVTRKNKQGRIVDGYFTAGEWVDYVGITANCKPIAFDAKESSESTRFDHMKNVPLHQFNFLKSWNDKGAYTFLVVRFIKRSYETYILPFEELEKFYKAALEGGRQSITYDWFFMNCEKITPYKGIRLHYLRGVM